jgi:hypothetical protein
MLTTPGLTEDNPTLAKRVRATVPGMAHFAYTGPRGKCCGDCSHLMPRGALGYGCMQFQRMMQAMVREEIPRTTPSCKYFEERKRDGKPDRTAKRRRP